MRIVGTRKERPITFFASPELLVRGVRFNEEIHRTFDSRSNGVAKGVYRFKSHQEADAHQAQCIAEKMASLAKEFKRGE